MRLSKDRFSKAVFTYRSEETKELGEATRYSYETKDALYDLDLFPVGAWFSKNCRASVFTPIHKAIVKHFNLANK